MERRRFLKSSGLTLAALTFFNSKNWASIFSDDFKIRMLNKYTGIFIEKGGTILFQLGDEGPVIVDAQFPDSAAHLITKIKEQTTKPFKFLINTHHHPDHTSGNIDFKNLVPNVLAHENSLINQRNLSIAQKNEDKQYLPNLTYKEEWSQKIGKEKIMLKYFGPGHTNGDSIVYFKSSNIVHIGDLVFNRMHPYIDKPYGANILNWITILDNIIKTTDKKSIIICGHAAEGYDVIITKDDIIAFQKYLQSLLLVVKDAIKENKTREEVLQITEIPGSPDWKQGDIKRGLDAAYTELTETYK